MRSLAVSEDDDHIWVADDEHSLREVEAHGGTLVRTPILRNAGDAVDMARLNSMDDSVQLVLHVADFGSGVAVADLFGARVMTRSGELLWRRHDEAAGVAVTADRVFLLSEDCDHIDV